MPPMRDGVPVKQRSISSFEMPTASNTCAPQYDDRVEMPIFEIVLSKPLPIAFSARVRASSRSSSSRPSETSSSIVASIRYGLTAAAP